MRSLSSHSKRGLFRLFAIWFRSGNTSRRKKLAIFKTDGIGDFVLSSESIRQLIGHRGPEAVCLIVSQQVSTLAKRLFPDVEIVAVVPANASRFQKLVSLLALKPVFHGRSFEEIVCLRHYRTDYEELILCSLVADRVILLYNQMRDRKITTAFSWSKNLQFIRPLPLIQGESDMKLPQEWFHHSAVLSASFGHHITALSMRPNWDLYRFPQTNSRRFLLVAPMAGSRIRDLPINLIEAGVLRASECGLTRVVLTGTRAQASSLHTYAEKLTRALPFCKVEVFNPPDLEEFLDLISRSSAVFTAESSTAHIATALDKPALILIGGGHYGWFAPWSRSTRQVWLTHKLSCFDCNWFCPYAESFCITGISPSEVMTTFPGQEVLNARVMGS
jgi:ADP-heptose:LPS heptosyltransferase